MRNTRSKTKVETTAPACTTQNMPGLPSRTKKSRKSKLAWPPSIMAVVSPTKVAAPCKLEDTAIAMMLGTGETFNFFAMVKATGATMSTVATLSIKAEIMPANRDKAMIAHLTLGVLRIIKSASRAGILDSINKETIPIVPAIIMMTFQSTAKNT